MPLVSITIELPQYSRTFSVDVPQEGSILDVKVAVRSACPGEPRVDGQRLIYKGRTLEDEELVQQLWKEGEPRVVHLAVHPASWSKGPPEPPQLNAPSSERLATPEEREIVFEEVVNQLDDSLANLTRTTERLLSRPRRTSPVSFAPSTYPTAPQYIVHLHFKALCALTSQLQMPARAVAGINEKDIAKQSVQAAGQAWPAMFDEEFPPSDGADSGVSYTFAIVDSKPYLQLNTPEAEPTPTQKHAVRVLSYTFPLLATRARTFNRTIIRRRTDVVIQPQPAVQLRPLPIRALLAPLILLGLRTLLLLYFFSPARKPLFSILLAAWVIYEAWGAVRGAFVELNDANMDGNPQQPAGVPAGAGAQRGVVGNNLVDPVVARNAADRARPRNGQRNSVDHLLSRLARINLASEEHALSTATNADEPGFLTKAQSFIALFVLTLYPDIWKRRRKALREREGRIRAETIKRRVPTEEDQTIGGGSEEMTQARQRLIDMHERRRPWVKEYIQRVEQDEWVDE